MVPYVRHANPEFVASLDEDNKETCPGVSYEKWWFNITTSLELTKGVSTILKEDI